MKGLTLNCMGKKEEAYEFVRSGLRHDLKSHVCWHVFGLLYRSDRNYHEAIKCYRNAIRIDPENLQILRDLYLLQVQMRDLKGHAETRRTMLTLKPNNRNNWMGFAISHHLVGNYQMAIDIIDKYFGTLEAGRSPSYEDSEIYLYQNQLIEETGDLERALTHLDESKDRITDTLAWRRKKAELLLRTAKFEDARAIYEELLDINFDDYGVHAGLQCAILERSDLLTSSTSNATLPCAQIDFATEANGAALAQKLEAYYDEAAKKADNVKSVIPLRFPLDFTSGDKFKARTDALLKRQLTKGVPSLNADLKTLYGDKKKIATIEQLVLAYVKQLEAGKPLVAGDKTNAATVLTWTRYFLAQHYDRLGQHEKALKLVEQCIEQSPSTLDFYQRKARVLKHMGELSKAADVMVQGRKLDLADRYINNKATEYLLHADRIEEADATIALFTRHEGDPQQNLFDMQCMWYEIECGRSRIRKEQHGLALKRFFAVEKHFNDFVEDQFDFHTYCIRKMTLRAYLQMLRLCDEIYGHPFFVKAAHGAIDTYLTLADRAAAEAAMANGANGSSGLSAAEKKKAKRAQAKARKAEFKKKEEEELRAKQQKEAEEKEREAAKNGKKSTTAARHKEPPKDADPFGEELTKKPALDEAWRFVSILQKHAPQDVQTHLAAFDIALRKKKLLLCLQALLRAKALAAPGSEAAKQVAERRVRFQEEAKSVTNAVVKEVIQANQAALA